MALISLPEPCHELEAYFVALIHRPLRILPFSFVSDTTKVVALNYAGEGSSGAKAMLVEWTRHMAREEIGAAQPGRILPGGQRVDQEPVTQPSNTSFQVIKQRKVL